MTTPAEPAGVEQLVDVDQLADAVAARFLSLPPELRQLLGDHTLSSTFMLGPSSWNPMRFSIHWDGRSEMLMRFANVNGDVLAQLPFRVRE